MRKVDFKIAAVALILAFFTTQISTAAFAQTSPDNRLRRCAPREFSSRNFRNVTEPGDVRILLTDQVVLINKRTPIDGNYGSQSFRRVGARWMIQ
jgi:hypothetical protein